MAQTGTDRTIDSAQLSPFYTVTLTEELADGKMDANEYTRRHERVVGHLTFAGLFLTLGRDLLEYVRSARENDEGDPGHSAVKAG